MGMERTDWGRSEGLSSLELSSFDSFIYTTYHVVLTEQRRLMVGVFSSRYERNPRSIGTTLLIIVATLKVLHLVLFSFENCQTVGLIPLPVHDARPPDQNPGSDSVADKHET